MKEEYLHAGCQIARAYGLLASNRFVTHWPAECWEGETLVYMAANCREAARLCMAAAALLDPQPEPEGDPMKEQFR